MFLSQFLRWRTNCCRNCGGDAKRRIVARSITRYSARQFERLEDRALLAIDVAAALFQSPRLQVVPEAVDDAHLLVRFRHDVAKPEDYLREALSGGPENAVIEKPLSLVPGLQKVRVGEGASRDAILTALRNDPRVLYAEPDYRVTIAAAPNDTRFAEQWDLHNVGQTGGTFDADIDAPEAWDVATGSGGTIVAVIDTGIDYSHPDLAANIWINTDEIPGDGVDNDLNGYIDDVRGYDFYNHDANPMDDHGHGTHVAGTIGAVGNNGQGVAGIHWNVRLMTLKFLGADGSGTTSDAIEAIRYAVENGAQISNNSWGGDPYSQALFDAIRDARDANHLFVTAAGNGNVIGFGVNNDVTPFYPASFNLDNIVTVAATDHRDARAIFSNYGAQSVDLGAPGVSILSTTPGGGYGLNSGTSMAAPHVAGALSLVRDAVPGLTYRQLIDRVLTSVDPVASMEDRTVTGGRLNVSAALVPDTIGPRIVAASPAGMQLDPVGSLRITFDETIDAATFTLADIVNFSGPAGPVIPASLQPVAGSNGREFTLNFPTQSTFGEYQITIGPDIRDRHGNPLDQDGDGLGGEPVEDRFHAGFSIVNAVARFDFGTATSPVAPGYTRLVHTERYSATIGYGWQVGSVYSIKRSGADPLTSDFNYTADATFALDVPNGDYHARITLGDNGMPHDQMGVYLEGVQFASVNTSSGQPFVGTYRTSVSDGQLSLRLRDLGGDPWVMINALDVIYAGPDLTGPYVLATNPSSAAVGPLDGIEVAFSESIADGSFTLDDVLLVEGPGGPITPTAVQRLSGNTFEVRFAAQNAAGTYRLLLGPGISDVAGNLLDQDRDGVGGEANDDRFELNISLEAGPVYVARFDFGTATSPVAEGYTQLVHTQRYSAATGYGWLLGGVYSIKRSNQDPLTRDFNYTADATFALDLPNGEYDVRVTLGDNSLPHDLMGVHVEGALVDTVTTAIAEFFVGTYRTSVSDGQLNLRLRDLGGSEPWVMINALDVIAIQDPPTIASTTGAATTGAGPIAGRPDVAPLTSAADHLFALLARQLDAASPRTVRDHWKPHRLAATQ